MGKSFQTLDDKMVMLTEETEEHLLAHPEVLPFLEEAISKLTLTDADKNVSSVEKEVDFGKNIGVNSLVETREILPESKMIFAYRKARKYPTHVVVGGVGENCNVMTVQIRFDKLTVKWFLMTAYIGYADSPLEPFYIPDKNAKEFKDSLEFWSQHALVYSKNTMGTPFESTWQDELNKKIILYK